MMRAVGYVRVSSDEQVESGLGLSDQERAIRGWADANHAKLLTVYRDAGISGARRDRPGLLALIEAAERRDFDVLIVNAQDRLSRDRLHMLLIMRSLRAAGIQLISTTQPFLDGSEDGDLMSGIIGELAEWERRKMGRRQRDAKREAARQGYVLGDPPYGYRRGSNSVFAIVETEAAVVRESYQAYRAGSPAAAVAEWLNERGLRTRTGRLWSKSALHHILRNPTYAGLVSYKGEVIGDGRHAPIIDRSLWDDVRSLSAARRFAPRKRPYGRQPYPLSGVAHCRAGHRLAGHGSRRYRYMRCTAAAERGATACRQPMVRADLLEAQIGAYVATMQVPDAFIATTLEAARDLLTPPPGDRAELRRELDTLVRLHREGYLAWDMFSREAEPLRRQLQQSVELSSEFDIEQAATLVRDQGGQWRAMTMGERRAYVIDMFDSIAIEGAQVTALEPKNPYKSWFIADHKARFGSVCNMVGPAGFEPATGRL